MHRYHGNSTFSSLQGNPVRVLIENGTNFVGAERELRESIAELDQERIIDELGAHVLQWSFNPPTVLTVDEVFLTVITEVE